MKTIITIFVLIVTVLLAICIDATISRPAVTNRIHNKAVQMVKNIEIQEGKKMSLQEFEQVTNEFYADLVEGEED